MAVVILLLSEGVSKTKRAMHSETPSTPESQPFGTISEVPDG